MTESEPVTRQEWLKARKELLLEEKRLMRLNDKLTVKRQSLPAVKIETDYLFSSKEGQITLRDLFGSSRQLIIYHFMFAPDWKEGCPSCSFWADSFNGAHEHLTARDTAFACISIAPLEKLDAYKKRLGWFFPWVSAAGTSFGADFGVSFYGSPEQSQEQHPEGYNYSGKAASGECHGLSVFKLNLAGDILHTYSTYGRGIETFNTTYNLLDLTPTGRNEDELDFTMSWIKRRDCY